VAEADQGLWPTELRLTDRGRGLRLSLESGAIYDLSAEYLRVSSPSAEVRGHAPHERKTVPGKENVAIREIVPVGNYAVRLVFDDGHATGIYSWTYLAQLGAEYSSRWRVYLDELAARGLARFDPHANVNADRRQP
jgi:DUF971 family protein